MRARFRVGELIRHRQYGYRGVVANVDPQFADSPEWYARRARGALGGGLPTYYVLVDGAAYATYVGEASLERDDSGMPVQHPYLPRFFAAFRGGRYVRSQRPH